MAMTRKVAQKSDTCAKCTKALDKWQEYGSRPKLDRPREFSRNRNDRPCRLLELTCDAHLSNSVRPSSDVIFDLAIRHLPQQRAEPEHNQTWLRIWFCVISPTSFWMRRADTYSSPQFHARTDQFCLLIDAVYQNSFAKTCSIMLMLFSKASKAS